MNNECWIAPSQSVDITPCHTKLISHSDNTWLFWVLTCISCTFEKHNTRVLVMGSEKLNFTMTSLQVCYIGCVVRAHSLQVNFACSLFDPLTYCFLLPRLEENQGLEKRLSLTPTIGYQLLYLVSSEVSK